jgi:hypothetical protein
VKDEPGKVGEAEAGVEGVDGFDFGVAGGVAVLVGAVAADCQDGVGGVVERGDSAAYRHLTHLQGFLGLLKGGLHVGLS